MQCENCQSYNGHRTGNIWFFGGIVFTILSIPWVFILIGIPFFIVGILLTLAGVGRKFMMGNPWQCKDCKWEETTRKDVDAKV